MLRLAHAPIPQRAQSIPAASPVAPLQRWNTPGQKPFDPQIQVERASRLGHHFGRVQLSLPANSTSPTRPLQSHAAARGESVPASSQHGTGFARGPAKTGAPIQCSNGHDNEHRTPYLPPYKLAGMAAERLFGLGHLAKLRPSIFGLSHSQGHLTHSAVEAGGLPMQGFLTRQALSHSAEPGDRFRQASGIFGLGAGAAGWTHVAASAMNKPQLAAMALRAAPPLGRASILTLGAGAAWARSHGRNLFFKDDFRNQPGVPATSGLAPEERGEFDMPPGLRHPSMEKFSTNLSPEAVAMLMKEERSKRANLRS